MSGEEKAAVLLKGLPPPVTEAVLARLGPERGARLKARLQELGPAEEWQGQLDEVLRELEASLEEERVPARPPSSAVLRIRPEPPPEEPPAPAPEPAPAPPPRKADEGAADQTGPMAALRALPVERLAQALQGESARTVSVVVNYLQADLAGEVFKRLPQVVRCEVSLQLGTAAPPGPEIAERIARAVLEKAQALRDAPAETNADGRYKKMAEMLRQLEGAERKDLLAALEQRDAALAAGVRQFLFLFEDLLRIEDRALQKLLSDVDTKSVALSLCGATEEIRQKVMSNLSKRAREALGEEMGFLGTPSAAAVREAQQVVVQAMQRLDQAGGLTMRE